LIVRLNLFKKAKVKKMSF